MAKTTAIIELGYGTKIVCPIGKLSTLMSVLENCRIVNEQTVKENFTGQLNDRGSAECDFNRYFVDSGDEITAKIVPAPTILTRDEYRMRDAAADKREEEVKHFRDESHPWQIKVGENEYFTGERFRTRAEAIEFGRHHYGARRKGFHLYQLDSFDDSFEANPEYAD